jgi:hypothetical protein
MMTRKIANIQQLRHSIVDRRGQAVSFDNVASYNGTQNLDPDNVMAQSQLYNTATPQRTRKMAFDCQKCSLLRHK